MDDVKNHSEMRRGNVRRVFKAVQRNGALSRSEIQRETGLSWGAVSTYTQELVRRNFLVETAKSDNEYEIGRRPNLVSVNEEDNYVLGIDLNAAGINVAALPLRPAMKRSWALSLPSLHRTEVLRSTIQLLHTVIDHDLKDFRTLAIGVAAQGAVDHTTGVSLYSPHFDDWHDVPIESILEKEFGLPVVVDHDPNCIMYAEQSIGRVRQASSGTSAALIRIDSGIGMAVLINGEIFRGAGGNAGEIGHVSFDPAGPRCSCGNHGCLECYASEQGLLERYAELHADPASAPKTFEELAMRARRQEPEASRTFELMGSYLGRAIGIVRNLFNPDLVILQGRTMAESDLFLDRAIADADSATWQLSRTEIVVSALDTHAAAIGAAIMATEQEVVESLLFESVVPL